jgi:hypothetical protein
MTNDQPLVLVSANKNRGRSHRSYDDYDVRLGDASGEVIGRIFRAPQSPQGRNWFWTITERAPQKPTERGYAPSREDAMAALKSAWDPMPKGKRNVEVL